MALRYFEKTYTVDGSDDSIGIETVIITLASWDAGDKFKIAYNGTKTAFIESGVNGTAADIQAELRTLTGDTGLAVTGTTDTGPFTVTFTQDSSGFPTFAPVDIFTVTDGTGSATGTTKVSLIDPLYIPETPYFDLGPYVDEPNDTDTSVETPHRWRGKPPFLIQRVAVYVTTGSGMTYELVDCEWANEIVNEGTANLNTGPRISPPYPVNALWFAGDAFDDGDVLDLYVWYESRGDQRF